MAYLPLMVAPRGLGDFSTLLEGGVGEVDVVFKIHIFFAISKGL